MRSRESSSSPEHSMTANASACLRSPTSARCTGRSPAKSPCALLWPARHRRLVVAAPAPTCEDGDEAGGRVYGAARPRHPLGVLRADVGVALEVLVDDAEPEPQVGLLRPRLDECFARH